MQRIFVESPVYKDFLDLLVPAVEALRVGDPADEATDVCPLIRTTGREPGIRHVVSILAPLTTPPGQVEEGLAIMREYLVLAADS